MLQVLFSLLLAGGVYENETCVSVCNICHLFIVKFMGIKIKQTITRDYFDGIQTNQITKKNNQIIHITGIELFYFIAIVMY